MHFTPYEPGDSRTTSGVRKSSDVAIYIDLQKALKHDVPFFMSSNHVILSPGIDGVIASDYIFRLRNLITGADLDLASAMDTTTKPVGGRHWMRLSMRLPKYKDVCEWQRCSRHLLAPWPPLSELIEVFRASDM